MNGVESVSGECPPQLAVHQQGAAEAGVDDVARAFVVFELTIEGIG